MTDHAVRTLVVLVPGLGQKTIAWGPLIDALEEEGTLGNAHWLRFDHHAGPMSFTPALQIVRELAASIKGCWEAEGGFSEVVLVGHSIGGVLIREAYLIGCRVDDPDVGPQPWAERVRRIVLLASINRGFDPDRRLWTRLAVRMTQLVRGRNFPLVGNVLRGSPFITNLRIRWIRHMAHLGPRAPNVVQVLGTRDGVVSREDSLDLRQPQRFRTIEIPGANHRNVYRTKDSPFANHFELVASAFAAASPGEFSAPVSPPGGKNVVFILHGIRANNSGWVEQLYRCVRERDQGAEIVKASYGYFSALDFALPPLRRRNIEWFQDQYSYYLALHPTASFYFVGHSNGTYIFGQSLKRVGAISFERAVLTGCVLPKDYPWRDRFDTRQLREFRNVRARDDWPVGILCAALNRLWMRDIGKAGVEGFDFNDNKTQEVFYYEGGHSAALEEPELTGLVDYLIDGAAPGDVDTTNEPDGTYLVLSKFGHVLAFVLVFGLAVVGFQAWPWITEDATHTVGSIIAIWILIKIARSF